MKIKFALIFSLLLGLLFNWGCVGGGRQANLLSTYPSLQPLEIPPAVSEKPLVNDNSLWGRSSTGGYLFMDSKAKTVGDIITINIIEQASASGNASTKTGRKSSLSAGIPSFFGIEKSATKRNPNLDPTSLLKASTDNNFNGSGQISRSGKITATITARVTQVLSNNNLVIRGTRQVTINNEQQLLIIQGIIRPEDISPDNIIDSSSIAEAQIIYTGKGVVSDKQNPGWLTRVVDHVWPF